MNIEPNPFSLLDEWNSKDATPPYYIKWWHWLFLWLLPTRKTVTEEGTLYTKHIGYHVFVMGWKRNED
jgi:hypothetical protein